MPDQIILFQDADFHGAHKHVFDREPNLNSPDDSDFNDSVSSIAILSGNWRFFKDADFKNPYSVVLGPGLYSFVGRFKLSNDDMSSLTTVADPPTLTGDPVNAHAMLFEDANFHGDHRHLFAAEPNLDANGFNDRTSSIVVKQGNWSFFRNSGFNTAYATVLGPGIYPSVTAAGIVNDDLSSLQPTTARATAGNSVNDEVLLFKNANFHGGHKHVFGAEPNLNAADDSSFNDAVSSLVVLRGDWLFFADANFLSQYPPSLGPGAYSSVAATNIKNDDMSSLRPAAAVPVVAGDAIHAHVILFENANFHGQHRHILNSENNLNDSQDNSLNDKVSSIAVVSGNWQFFRDSDFHNAYPPILGPGIYASLPKGILNHDMSSLRSVNLCPTVIGPPLDAHIVLFKNINFHGDHKHVVSSEPNLNADDDNSFNDAVSSFVVLAGNWDLFNDADFDNYDGLNISPRVGPGLYANVQDLKPPILNDAISSLRPNLSGFLFYPPADHAQVVSHAILFENSNLRGEHKHVFQSESNLNAPDDNSMNDKVSSMAVLINRWRTFRDSRFRRPYDVILDTGLFPRVSDVGIVNDDMSSLLPVAGPLSFAGVTTFLIGDEQVGFLAQAPNGTPMSLIFFPDSRLLRIATMQDMPGQGAFASNLIAQFNSAGDGNLPAGGALTIPDVNFSILLQGNSATGPSESTAQCSLSTGSVTSPHGQFHVNGRPVDATGQFSAVGAGTITGGFLNGVDFYFELSGGLRPWPL